MIPARTDPPATVCGHPLHHAAHICAFFDSREQEYACLVPYFAEGLARREQVVTIRDAANLREHVETLKESGAIPVDEVNARRLTALIYREYLDSHFLVPKPDKLIAADIGSLNHGDPTRINVRVEHLPQVGTRVFPDLDRLRNTHKKVSIVTGN